MGGAAGKQPKVNRIYVKSRSTSDDQDEVFDDTGVAVVGQEQFPSSSSAALANAATFERPGHSFDGSTFSDTLPGSNSFHDHETACVARAIPMLEDAASTAHKSSRTDTSTNMIPRAGQALDDVKMQLWDDNDVVHMPGNDTKAQSSSSQGRQGIGSLMQTTIRSISSDEGSETRQWDSNDMLTPRSIPSDERLATDLPSGATMKMQFAQALQEGRQSQERVDWLRSLGEAAAVPPVVQPVAPPALATSGAVNANSTSMKHGAGFNLTRRPMTVLRDPDIYEEMSNWNTNLGAYRTEIPRARPVQW
jgi:hypothetical protein